METKTYDYKGEAVRTKIVDAFERGKREATVADLVTLTGLPKIQVDEQMRSVSDEFGARLKVTESGEILYSFPSGMRSRYSGFGPSFRKFWKSFKAVSRKVLTMLFKAWIVVMLVGYFVLFVAIALVAVLASFAVSVAGSQDKNSSRRGNAGLGIGLTMRLIELFVRIWFYSELFKGPYDRAYGREQRKKNKRPLHHAVFSFVFGDGDPNLGWETEEKKLVLAFIQANKGVMSLEEFMILTGMGPEEAQRSITAYLVEYEGNPEVTESGTIYFSFPEIMRRAESRSKVFSQTVPFKLTEVFSKNPKKANVWFSVLNGVNLIFGSYFLFGSLAWGTGIFTQVVSKIQYLPSGSYLYYIAGILASAVIGNDAGAVVSSITSVLGFVPLTFAALFYLVPVLRKGNLIKRNEAIKSENLRKIVYRRIWDNPSSFEPSSLAVSDPQATPAKLAAEAEKLAQEMAAWKEGEVIILPSGNTGYIFKELVRERVDMEDLRSKIDLSRYDLGKTVFDSHAPGNS